MENKTFKSHWENVYETKSPEQVSWTQQIPEPSLSLIKRYCPGKECSIIDIGGGDSKLVDHLLDEGFSNVSVLDISCASLERAKKRLGEKADKVNWICKNVLELEANKRYDVWHDRAAFHFLTNEQDRKKYINLVSNVVKGHLILATFSKNGPKKCSGLDICQYDENEIQDLFSEHFTLTHHQIVDHTTPFGTDQNFIYSVLSKK